MLKQRTLAELRKQEFLKLSELARLLDVSRPLLAQYVRFDLLPYHHPPGRRARYYRPAEIRRVLAALEPLRAKEIPLKYTRAELEALRWYKELREREQAERLTVNKSSSGDE